MLSQVGQSLKYCLKWRVPRTSEWPQLTFLTRISWLWPVNYFYMKKYDENWKLEQSWEAAAFTPPPASSPGQVVTTCSECDLNQYVDTCSTAETLQNIAVLHPSSFILITTTSAESISKHHILQFEEFSLMQWIVDTCQSLQCVTGCSVQQKLVPGIVAAYYRTTLQLDVNNFICRADCWHVFKSLVITIDLHKMFWIINCKKL